MAKINFMGKFTAIGMRTAVKDLPPNSIVVNTCGRNDTAEKGDSTNWVFCNPTNRAIIHAYEDVVAVSVECLWQGTKIREGMTKPDQTILGGNWRAGKGRKPLGAWAGPDKPLITTPGEARRAIYIPAFKNLIEHWLQDDEVLDWIEAAMRSPGRVFLRDHDVGRGLDQNGPMSHAWLFCEWLNNDAWPN